MTPVPHRGVRLCAAVLAAAALLAACQRAGNPIAEAAIERAARSSIEGGGGLRSATLSFNRNHGDARVIVGVQLRRQLQ